jgi:TPR repeat protein
MYADGQGVAQDYVEAARWYRKAADQGNALAEFDLAEKYNVGQGVPQDYAEASRWFLKAAEHGSAAAQFTLGMMYAKGQSVKRDYIEAYMWLNLASSITSGDVQAKYLNERELIAKKMSAKQIAEGQRRAREWKPANSR